ncbi:hypothetical protein [Limosilactobacillus ingluviei]|uniref:Plasmid replication initiation protein n=1 Tax=Limosilactobacillus ingluviei DSM 15946 TaxID=1423760 RepID=A0A0R1UEE2_9LACO|nr:hypothetical protein [Limosilactobacillus ingluviei]KRL91678.1 hypothetical protein FC43_GL001099 [Limosilactobacillus ingluviei DSM 15946]
MEKRRTQKIDPEKIKGFPKDEQEILNRYANHPVIGDNTYAVVPHPVLAADLDDKSLGLYVYLSLLASHFPLMGHGDKRAIFQKQSIMYRYALGVDRPQAYQTKAIDESLEILEQAGFVRLVDDKFYGFAVILRRPKHVTGYVKIYATESKKILELSNSLTRFKHLATYTVLRKEIFETKEPSDRVITSTLKTIASKNGKVLATLTREVNWLCENRVMATFTAIRNTEYGIKRHRYLADIRDAKVLAEFVVEKRQSGELISVIG